VILVQLPLVLTTGGLLATTTCFAAGVEVVWMSFPPLGRLLLMGCPVFTFLSIFSATLVMEENKVVAQ